MQSNTFVEDLKSGKAKLEDLGEYIDKWHDADTALEPRDLHEYLGFLKQQDFVDLALKNIIPHYFIEAAKEGKQKGKLGDKTKYTKTFLDEYKKKDIDPHALSSFIERWHNSDDPRSLEDAIGISKEELENWSRNHILPPQILQIKEEFQKTSKKIEKLKARARNYKAMLKMSKKDK